jgi:tRNA/tmRNA/rRNA uracil-C5-methylase (TrmA/RlmC/RlmD family)
VPLQVVEGPGKLRHTVGGLDFDVSAGGFWQVHPAAAGRFAQVVLDELAVQPGESALDLYAGAGLFSALLARAVGPTGQVVGLESDAQAVTDAAANLAPFAWAEMRRARIDERVVGGLDIEPAVVVLDPPRSGAGPAVMSAVLNLGAARRRPPRVVVYVACDPASLARDVRAAAEEGWQLRSLRAFDAFPMTHHIECIATLTPN